MQKDTILQNIERKTKDKWKLSTAVQKDEGECAEIKFTPNDKISLVLITEVRKLYEKKNEKDI